MPKIVIVGSCKFAPYSILAVPDPIPNLHNTEEGYKMASKKFYPVIRKCDCCLVYAPDRKIGEHTQRDIDYARSQGKKVYWLVEI